MVTKKSFNLNESKAQSVAFYRKRRAYPFINTVFLRDIVVKRVDNVKILEIHTDFSLNWTHHINHVKKNCQNSPA